MKKLAFFNPPHADWVLPNVATWLFMQSHYNSVGKYKDQVEWLPAPYRYSEYTSLEEIYEEIKTADAILFSSYVWNYDFCDEMSKLIKTRHPEKLTILGGPHIGQKDPDLQYRFKYYDYICQPTKPGEPFIEEFLNVWIQTDCPPDPENIPWETRSIFGTKHDFPQVSIYEEHLDYLTKISRYAEQQGIEKYIVLETTRGCPYQCTYCEWGGGIGEKVIKKDIDIIKRDIVSIKKAGYDKISLNDANFGMYEDRDLEFYKFAYENDLQIIDVSTVKVKNLDRRKRLIDSCFEIVSSKYHFTKDNSQPDHLPTVSIQSASEEAMKVSKRVDLSYEDKLSLSEHIYELCEKHNFKPPAVELIMGMPGVRLNDFYKEMDIIWNFRSWNSYRHVYMALPDSECSSSDYIEKHKIQLVKVYANLLDEDSADNTNSLYTSKKNYFNTIASCYSFTREEMCQMFFMNYAGNVLLKEIYSFFEDLITPSEFCKKCWSIIFKLDDFQPIWEEIKDLYDPGTAPRTTKRLLDKHIPVTIKKFIDDNKKIIINSLYF
jgi:putative methyltransferase